MVKDAIEAAIEGKLAAPAARWMARQTPTSAPTTWASGSIVLSVKVLPTTAGAKALYAQHPKASRGDQKFNGLGQESFQAKDGTLGRPQGPVRAHRGSEPAPAEAEQA